MKNRDGSEEQWYLQWWFVISVEELLAGKQYPVLVFNVLCLHLPKNLTHREREKLNFLLLHIKGRTFL